MYTQVFTSSACVTTCTNSPSTDIDDLFDVSSELLDVAHNWKYVGEALRLKPSTLSRIQTEHRGDVRGCLNEILTEWLKKAYNTTRFGLPSWKLLVAAVAHPAGGSDRALAERIAGKYNGKMQASYVLLYVRFFPTILLPCHNRH